MKLSQYAKRTGVNYKTAWRWWKQGQLDAYQTPTGTVIVREPVLSTSTTGRVALYARVSSADQKADLEHQMQRLRDYAAAKGYTVAKEVREIVSGLNDHRPKLSKLLTDPTIGTLVVEHRDRLTRFGYEYIRQLLDTQGRHVEVLFPSDTKDELVDDFVTVIASMAAHVYRRRNAKHCAAYIQACVKQCIEQAEVVEAEGWARSNEPIRSSVI
ncbi:MAG TPA: IS607 family transposase [Ktedonobacterales bacterium]|nr:IS607 family transposase [Ktedonobacterales bacterium]